MDRPDYVGALLVRSRFDAIRARIWLWYWPGAAALPQHCRPSVDGDGCQSEADRMGPEELAQNRLFPKRVDTAAHVRGSILRSHLCVVGIHPYTLRVAT